MTCRVSLSSTSLRKEPFSEYKKLCGFLQSTTTPPFVKTAPATKTSSSPLWESSQRPILATGIATIDGVTFDKRHRLPRGRVLDLLQGRWCQLWLLSCWLRGGRRRH